MVSFEELSRHTEAAKPQTPLESGQLGTQEGCCTPAKGCAPMMRTAVVENLPWKRQARVTPMAGNNRTS